MTPRLARLVRVLPLLVLGLLLAPSTGRADAFADALKQLASSDLDEVTSGVAALSATGDARAIDVLHELRDGKLKVEEGSDGASATVVAERGGKFVHVTDGTPAARSAKLRKLLSNNAVRRALAPALARLELASNKVELRRTAAEELRRNPSTELAPLLRVAYKRESDPDVKESLGLALAEVDLESPDADARLEAVRILGERGDLSFKTKLTRLVDRGPQGAYLEPDKRVRDAAEDVLS